MIYFIQAGDDGPIKIGQSDNPEERMAQLQTANASELKLLWVYSGDDWSESDIHNQLTDHLIRGEWFSPDEDIFDLIKNGATCGHTVRLVNFNGKIEAIESFSGKITVVFPCGDAAVYRAGDKSISILAKDEIPF